MQDRKDNLRKAVNALMKDYQWQAVAPDNGELATEVEDFPWDSQWPLKYKYEKTTDAPFKGSCIEQALYIKDHFPDSQFLYMKWPERGVNVLHVEPVLKDGSIYRTVHLNPRKDNYLSRRNYKKLENFIKGRISTQHDKDKPLDVYLLDDIPKSGTSKSLLDYAEKNGHKFRYRDGKLLDLVKELTKEGSAEVYDLPEIQRLEKELAALDYTVPDRTQTIKDILKDKKTSCWGISRIALERLKRAGLDPETVYVAEDDDDMRPTHQFTTYRDGDKYRIFDHWVTQQLLDELYPSREAAIDAGVENWRREGHPHSIRAYAGTYIPKPGKDFEEYMDAMERGNELLKKYPALEKSGSVYDLPEIQRLEKELSTLDYDWDDPYKTQTIKDILKSRKDHCWGVARLIRNRLRRAQLDPEVVYMKEEERDGVTPTHQFNTYKDGDDYRVLDYRVDNHSMFPFYGPRGKTREEAILKYLDAWRKEQKSFTGNVDIWTGNYIPKPGKDWDEYMAAIEKGNKLLKKYPALEKQSAFLKIAKLLMK